MRPAERFSRRLTVGVEPGRIDNAVEMLISEDATADVCHVLKDRQLASAAHE